MSIADLDFRTIINIDCSFLQCNIISVINKNNIQIISTYCLPGLAVGRIQYGNTSENYTIVNSAQSNYLVGMEIGLEVSIYIY